eukprot:CAMPEP_0182599772 /NCGR_PEP_ID=MMETSP1324-20130603/90650_1 /TAXON_ID=236786 /ORGANISM="Florenciella sp., Strain RCC1587" /LENGTH=118 /DNA_ID=CAMNT_0024817675 /DNA_START=435 /DNA_END=792 /DNA_ORIENTATION=-
MGGGNDGHHDEARPKQASQAAMYDAKLDVAYRDQCAALLIPLNKCRYETMYAPWECGHERHTYEKCQYIEFQKRVAALNQSKKWSVGGVDDKSVRRGGGAWPTTHDLDSRAPVATGTC